MSDIPIHASSLPECKILADLNSIANDLQLVVDITGRLITGETNTLLVRSLFSTGLITYRRCFNSGVRNGLTRNDLAVFEGKPIEMHDYLYAQANKLIAHSVNPFEHTQVGALVRDDKVIGVVSLSVQLILFNESQMEQWHRLSKLTLEQILMPRIEAARKVALEAVKKTSIEDVKKGSLLEYEPATADKANVRRP